MHPSFLAYKNSRVAWYRFGNGPQCVVCFHGFGETATGFSFLPGYAEVEFSFYAIDLPFHGQTEWREGLEFTHHDLLSIIDQITGGSATTWKLLGFSLGGRIALSLYQAKPERVEKLVLLAPDGLKVNFWYWIATRTWPGNRFFSFSMKYPGWFFGLLKLGNKLNLVNKSVFKFVNYYVGDKEARLVLYQRWTSLRRLKPNLEKIKTYIRANKTNTTLLYGKHDRIILSSVGEKFQRGIEAYCTLTVIEAGHQVLHENYANEIVRALK